MCTCVRVQFLSHCSIGVVIAFAVVVGFFIHVEITGEMCKVNLRGLLDTIIFNYSIVTSN